MTGLDGILLIDKPEGPTSAHVVRVLKRALRAEKIGHLGTLDPFASGVLPVCIGAGTKLSAFLMTERKTYEGTIRLGAETDTLDRTGAVTRRLPVPPVDAAAIEDVERRYTGEVWQTPPMYSALKRDGVPLYEFARRGVQVERAPRCIRIFSLTLEADGPDRLRFSVSCSKGTYVRVLAADMGAALHSVGHLASLRRISVGPFTLDQATPLDAACEPGATLPLLSVEDATRAYRTFAVSAETAAHLRRGQQAGLSALPAAREDEETARILDRDGRLVALLTGDRAGWKLARVWPAPKRNCV